MCCCVLHAQALALEFGERAGDATQDGSLGDTAADSTFYEITIATVDQPKLLSRLSDAMVRNSRWLQGTGIRQQNSISSPGGPVDGRFTSGYRCSGGAPSTLATALCQAASPPKHACMQHLNSTECKLRRFTPDRHGTRQQAAGKICAAGMCISTTMLTWLQQPARPLGRTQQPSAAPLRELQAPLRPDSSSCTLSTVPHRMCWAM